LALPCAAALWLLAAQGPSWVCSWASPRSRGLRVGSLVALRAKKKRDTGEFDFGEFDAPAMDTGGVSVMDLDEEDVNVLELAPPEAEVFMQRPTGKHQCLTCPFEYNQMWGHGDYGPGTEFESLPEDWTCPQCGGPKVKFETLMEEVAGFAENQKYGLGFNSWTANEKGTLIGTLFFLAVSFFLYCYTLE